MLTSTAIPCLRYRDAPAAIEWLCSVFGFERHLVVADDAGGIAHAQLVMGHGMIMLGSVRDDDYGRSMRQPDEIGTPGTPMQTQTSYLVVTDPDAVHARGLAMGMRIVTPLKDEDHGGRSFSGLDPEGHLWNIGSYDPWV